MKLKTSELTGATLDWAVWACEKPNDEFLQQRRKCRPYSTDWSQGGPIIEREQISIRYGNGQWVAEWWADNAGMAKNPSQRFTHNRFVAGPTALIAAMRCYVASKLGNDVNIPSELEAA